MCKISIPSLLKYQCISDAKAYGKMDWVGYCLNIRGIEKMGQKEGSDC